MTSTIQKEETVKAVAWWMDIYTMREIEALAHEVSSERPMTVEEMNSRATKIAEAAWTMQAEVIKQLVRVIVGCLRNGQPAGCSEAYKALHPLQDKEK